MEARFLKHVNKTEGCWLWTGSISRRYGMFRIGNKTRRVNRVAYELWKGEIPEGLHILHSCDEPRCVNPEHLRTGTNDENVKDRHERKRWADMKGVKNSNNKLSEDDVKEIRVMCGFFNRSEVARMYGVTPSTTHEIYHRKKWCDI
jgi:hypothetical protein